MKKKIAILLSLMSMVALLAACGKTNEPAPGESEKPPVADTAVSDKEQLEKYSTLVGNPEQGLIDLLGNGKETKAENGDVTSREYEINIFDKALPLQATIDVGNVLEISIPLEGDSYDAWVEKLTTVLGKPSHQSGPDQEEGSDSVASTWSLTEGTVTLQSAYGSLWIALYPSV